MKEYTFTCIECKRTMPLSEGSISIKFTCKSCAIKILNN